MSGDGGGLEARLRERRGLVAAERAAADEELAQQPTNQPKKQKKQSTHQKKSANQPKNEENMKKIPTEPIFETLGAQTNRFCSYS